MRYIKVMRGWSRPLARIYQCAGWQSAAKVFPILGTGSDLLPD
ncbi:MAG: hypothetical protein ACM3PT_11875 [Deltaproteobacteria bacterium]